MARSGVSRRSKKQIMQIIIRQVAARLSPSGGTTFQTTCFPVSFGKSFMKIRSKIRERLSHNFGGRKKDKKYL